MTRAEMKERAKAALGNKIFGGNWFMAVLAVLLQAIIVYAVGAVPGVGGILSVLLYGPISVGVVGIFLNQSRTLQQIDVGNMFGGFSKDFGGNLLLDTLGNSLELAVLLQGLARDVERDVSGINHAAYKVVVVGQKVGALFHDQHVGAVERQTLLVVLAVQIERRTAGNEQQRVILERTLGME